MSDSDIEIVVVADPAAPTTIIVEQSGVRGPQGEPGTDSTVPGPQGLAGEVGEQGPQGEPGDPGTTLHAELTDVTADDHHDQLHAASHATGQADALAAAAIGAATTGHDHAGLYDPAGAAAALVDSAPETLDTLNELAAALGDDPNLATTITTSLAGKASTGDLTTHATGTSSVHGIADTTALVLDADPRLTNQRIPVDGSVTETKLAFPVATQAELDAHAATSHGGTHPDLTAHDALGLATQGELDAHAATSHGGTHPDLAAHNTLGLATQTELDTEAAAREAADAVKVNGTVRLTVEPTAPSSPATGDVWFDSDATSTLEHTHSGTYVAPATLAASGKGFVNHGSTAGTARPTGYASVEWFGTVEPTNWIDGDTWNDPSA